MDYSKFENNVQSYTTAVKEKMLIINGTAVSIDNKVEDVKSDISTLMNDVSALDSSFRIYVDEHSYTHFVLGKDIENINSSISGIKSDVTSLNTLIYEKIEEQAESATVYFSNIDASISGIKSNVVSINSSISNIKTDVSTLDSSVVALIDSDAVINSSISSMKAKETALDSSVVALISADSQINSSISSIKTDVNSLKTSIGTSADTSTATSIYGLIAALRADFEVYELITAAALTDISSRLDNANIA